ncbi:MAG: nicotinate-nucleotide adenylyltransferase [Pseudomonadota bacterium]
MFDIGVVQGRFQVFHNDHLKYIIAARERCRHLVTAVTNPDPFLTRDDESAPHRGLPRNNPLTYFERYAMVKAVLLDQGFAPQAFSVTPLPINFPELYRFYVPLDAVFFLTIYDDWGRRKLLHFQGQGLKTEILWEKPPCEKGITGEDVRRRIIDGRPWEHLVPPAAARLLKKWDLPRRLACLEAPENGRDPAPSL